MIYPIIQASRAIGWQCRALTFYNGQFPLLYGKQFVKKTLSRPVFMIAMSSGPERHQTRYGALLMDIDCKRHDNAELCIPLYGICSVWGLSEFSELEIIWHGIASLIILLSPLGAYSVDGISVFIQPSGRNWNTYWLSYLTMRPKDDPFLAKF